MNNTAIPNTRPDVLPDEPGGDNGFHAVFGNINVQPALSPDPIKDLDGIVIANARLQNYSSQLS